METYRHILTGQLMTVEKINGNIAKCKLLIPVRIKIITHEKFNDVAICNIKNLEKIEDFNEKLDF